MGYCSVKEFTKSSNDLNSLLAPVLSGVRFEDLIEILKINNLCKPLETVTKKRVEATQLGTKHLPVAHASTTNPTSSLAHCAQIKSTEKLIKIKELWIKYLQDLIEIETFNKDITDAAQLEALIKEKAQAELEFAVTMGELKVLFPCALSNAAPTKTRMGLTRFDLNKKTSRVPNSAGKKGNRKNPTLYTKNRKKAQLPKLRPIIKALQKRPSRILINLRMTSSHKKCLRQPRYRRTGNRCNG
ncbi:hypothetical protein TNIN_87501 [Trichonephila inaurata madagascariensis]|uniref:Uncharacterized protein n=1 Tax=Trichonephila inaurata madagascariensis TaxID=2747483 RepID=A0A8X7CQ13_9ARAC|nr:hypothetical protein TNIN_87501 [Trichonephila inaurata madagascariensis]